MLLTERTGQARALGTLCPTLCNWCVGSLTSYSFMNTEVLIIIIVRWGPRFRVQEDFSESLTILQIYLITKTALSPQLF